MNPGVTGDPSRELARRNRRSLRRSPSVSIDFATIELRCPLHAVPIDQERSLAISWCPRLVAHASGVAHSGSSGRLFGAPC